MYNLYTTCKLCPRECKVNRTNGAYGVCGRSDKIAISLASLHIWEEPCISGTNGSGTIFFKGCPLGCVYCQNFKISRDRTEGQDIAQDDTQYLADLMLDLQDKGAHNINLVTATHYVPTVARGIELARQSGLNLPIVYNTSGYEKVETLKMLDGLVDIYLTDLKYLSTDLATNYSGAKDYVEKAKLAIGEMVSQQPELVYDEQGLLNKGVIVRHLVLPGATCDSRRVVRYLYKNYYKKVIISIMNQYTPVNVQQKFTELNRTLTKEEYDDIVSYAMNLGIEEAYIQEGETARESFIPDF